MELSGIIHGKALETIQVGDDGMTHMWTVTDRFMGQSAKMWRLWRQSSVFWKLLDHGHMGVSVSS